jgi:hypothetical protein
MNDDDEYIDDGDDGEDMYMEDEEKELEAELDTPKPPAVYNTKDPWKILTRKQLQEENDKLIEKTNERLFLERGDCALLLQSYKCDPLFLLSVVN